MLLLVYLVILSGSTCIAHYRIDRNSQNLIERDQPYIIQTELVECPVCENTSNWIFNEECNVERGSKRYKRCKWGVYSNQMCGGRMDCFKGPGERCTEKMELDFYGQRCTRGTYCNKVAGICTGLGFGIDSNVQWQMNRAFNPDHRFYASIVRDTNTVDQ